MNWLKSIHIEGDSRYRLSPEQLGELYRIREDLHNISAAVPPLQNTEDSLYPVSSNLEQIKRLILHLLKNTCDDREQNRISDEICRLKQQIEETSPHVAVKDQSLSDYSDGFNMDQTESIPGLIHDMDAFLLEDTQEALKAIQNALMLTTAWRNEIQCRLTDLHQQAENLYAQLTALLCAVTRIDRFTVAQLTAQRTTMRMREVDNTAIAAHSDKINSLAAALLN